MLVRPQPPWNVCYASSIIMAEAHTLQQASIKHRCGRGSRSIALPDAFIRWHGHVGVLLAKTPAPGQDLPGDEVHHVKGQVSLRVADAWLVHLHTEMPLP